MKKYIYLITLSISLFFSSCSQQIPQKQNLEFSSYPVHFLGLVSGANCTMKYQLDLISKDNYYLRTVCFKNSKPSKSSDDIGKWLIDDKNTIVLSGIKESPKYFYIIDKKTISSELNHKLEISLTAKTLEPRVLLSGMYSYMADSGIFQECITGIKFPVVFEDENIALERAYLKNISIAGEKIKVHLDAQISSRKKVDSNDKIDNIIVKKFIKIIPKERCKNSSSKAKLENTYWKLTTVNNKAVNKSLRREAHMILNDGKIKGNAGCNGLGGSYKLDGDKISFSDKDIAMTRMFCQDSPEIDFIKALKNMHTYKIQGEYLEIFDKDGLKLARFESVYLY
ncbi:META domain-containing protein [Sulfurimonas sp.]|uniref:META domain-containing protein n=1 Tax=Sulfurimonas sp. TaxID=2022749 RepID=UPI002AAF0C73|nr:META domain-containing protein [Sulfurimonas sp.]